MRIFLIAALCLLALGCATSGKSQSRPTKVVGAGAVYCLDPASQTPVRRRHAECRPPELQLTESQYAAFVGSGVLPDAPNGQRAIYCFDLAGPGAYRELAAKCKKDRHRITETEYAAYFGSGEFPAGSLPVPKNQEDKGFIYCLDPVIARVYSGWLYHCMPGDQPLHRFEYLQRLKAPDAQ